MVKDVWILVLCLLLMLCRYSFFVFDKNFVVCECKMIILFFSLFFSFFLRGNSNNCKNNKIYKIKTRNYCIQLNDQVNKNNSSYHSFLADFLHFSDFSCFSHLLSLDFLLILSFLLFFAYFLADFL